MTLKEYTLPEYPYKNDVWDVLAKEARPIVVYGMGNGADKLFRRFEKYGIKVSEVFASDGFVRGHSFRGFKVKSFSEIKAEYPDFVIVLSFASNREEVITMLGAIDREYEMYIPDMPVADESEYFDRSFYNSHYEEIARVYESLADELSKNLYASVLHYKLSGKMEHLMHFCSDKSEMYSMIGRERVKTVIDAGAYNGDTAREAIAFFPNLNEIYAIEPDAKNCKKLRKFAESSDIKINVINAAAWSECGLGSFSESGNRNSSVSSTASHEHRHTETELISLDSLSVSGVDYIKYDVEGAEYEALVGSYETIKKEKPALLVSLYHRSRDIFFLTGLVAEKFPYYKLYMRRICSIPAWELNLIAIKG